MKRANLVVAGVCAGVLGLASCTNQFNAPPEAVISCKSDADCPSGWKCSKVAEICVTADDTTPPEVTRVTLSPKPPVLNKRGVLEVEFELSEPQTTRGDPTVRIDGLEISFDKSAIVGSEDRKTWTASYPVSGTEKQDKGYRLVIDVEDRFGNQGGTSPADLVRFDFEPPSVTDVALSGSPARAGGQVRLEFTASEELADKSVVVATIGEKSFPFSRDSAVKAPKYAFVLAANDVIDAATPAELEGSATLTVEDLAGNPVTVAQDAKGQPLTLRFDTRPPTLNSAQVLVQYGTREYAHAREASTVTLRMVVSEALSGPPTVTLRGDPMNLAQAEGTLFVYSLTVPGLSGEQSFPVTFAVSFADAAGNPGGRECQAGATCTLSPLTTAEGTVVEVTYDPVPLDVVDETVLRRYRAGGTVEVLFSVSKLLPVDADHLLVQVGESSEDRLTCELRAGPGDAGVGVGYRCVLGLDDEARQARLAGTAPLTVEVTDLAGRNKRVPLGSLVFDFTPPVASLSAIPVGRPAHRGETLAVELSGSEPMEDFTVDPPGFLDLPAVGSGTRAVFSRQIAEEEGEQVFTFGAKDLAGNPAVSATCAGVDGGCPLTLTVRYDGIAPRVKEGFVLEPSSVKAGGEFFFAFASSEALAAAPRVTYSNNVDSVPDAGGLDWPMEPVPDGGVLPPALQPGDGGGFPYVFRANAPTTGSSQYYTVTVAMADLAENPGIWSMTQPLIVDNTPPKLAGFQVTPESAKLNDRVRVVLTADERMRGAPMTLVARTPAPVPPAAGTNYHIDFGRLDLQDDKASYAYEGLVDATLASGTYTFDSFTLTDIAGNASPPVDPQKDLKIITVDNVPPEVLAPIAVRNGDTHQPATRFSTAAGFNKLEVEFQVSEEVGLSNLTVAIGADTLACTLATAGAPATYLCTATLPFPKDPSAGLKTVQVTARDAAGNMGTGSAVVEFDFTAPTAVASVQPELAPLGSMLTYSVAASEPLAGTPAPQLAVQGVAGWSAAVVSGTTARWTRMVTETDAPGLHPATVTGLCDLVGNCLATLSGVPVEIDNVLPTTAGPVVVTVTAGGTTWKKARSGAKVSAAFSVSEALSGLPVVTLGGEPMTCASSGGLSFTCERTVVAGTDAEGAAGLLAVMTDPAGNRGSANLGTALLDFTPPALQSSGATPSAARLGSVIAYSVTASEPLSAVPTLTATHSGGSTLAFAALAGTSYLFNHTVGASAANGTYTVSLGLSDEAGNTTTAPGTSFTVDATVPVLSAVSVTPTRASAVAGYSRITVAFDVSETVTVEVKVGGRAATCPAPAGLHYGCTFDVSSSLDTEGLRDVSLLVSDAAGNQAGDRRTVELDFTAPTLVGSGASPAVAKLGADIAYSLTASEALRATPTPAFQRSGGTETLAFTHLPGTTYAFTHTVGAGDVNGTYLPTFVLTDTVGNASATLTGDPVQIDSSVPVISAVTLAGGTGGRYSAQTGFKTVTLTFNVSEAISAANLSVAIGGRAMTCGAFQAGSPNVTCSYTVQGTEGEGNKAVAIEATDAAGNTGYGNAAAYFDFTAPTLLSSGANPAAAGLGAGILYAVSVSEPLSATPTPSFKRTAGLETLAFTHVTGTTYSWQHTVATGETSGTYAPTMSLVDLVGNTSTQTGTSFSVDSVVPVISNVQALGGAGGRYSAQAAYRAMSVTFDVSEAIAAGKLAVTLANGSGSLSMTCGAWQAASPNVSCSYTVTGSEVAGNKAVSIVATDAAGNTGYASTSVVFDFTAPTLLSTAVTPATAGQGADVAYTVTASEPLGATPAPVFNRVGGGGSLAFTYDTGSTYTWRHAVVGGDANGTYAPSFTLTDTVGNTSAVFDRLSPQVQSFNVDATVPVISSIALAGGAGGRYSAQTGFKTVTLTFNVSESIVPANLSVTLANGAGSLALSCGAWQAATPNVTCTYAVTGSEVPDAKAISIEARDAAGNTGYGSTSVFFDFTAPSLLSSGANPPNAALGADIAYSITASEPLLATPVPVFNRSGGGAALAFTFKAGTTYTWTRAVAAGDSGTYAPSLTLTDSVGNVSTALTGASFQVDSVVPVVSGIAFAGGSSGRYSAHASYRALSVSFNVSESIDASRLSVVLANGASNLTLTCSPWQAATPNVTCTYTVLGTEQEGTRALSIEATDAAGNTGYGSDAVVFDFTPPSLASSGAVPAIAAVGTDVAYSVAASEALLSAPVPVFNRTGGGTLVFNYQSGTTYTWRHLVAAADLSGAYAPTLTLTDLVGNASGSLVGASFSVDSVPPAITNVTLSGGSSGRYSARTGYDLVTLAFNTGELIAAGKLSVTLADGGGPLSMTCGTWQASTPNVTCTYDVDGSEDAGSKAISIVATDGAGNAGYGSASVFFDFTAPTLLGTTVSPGSAKLGTDVSYTFSVSEPLLAAPSPVFGRVGGGGSLAFSFVTGSTYTWHRTIVAGDVNGNYAPSFTLTDAVGNPSVAYDSTNALVKTFAVDSTIPTISALTPSGGSGGRYSARPGYNVVTLTFNTSEQLGGVPGGAVVATLGNGSGTLPITCGSWQAVSPNFTCTYNVAGGEVEGTKVVTVTATDAAGNASTANTSVLFDFTAPSILSSGASPSNAPLNAEIAYSLTASEPLLSVPSPVFTRAGGGTMAFTHQPSSTYTFEHLVVSGDLSGTYTPTMTLTDVVGNVSGTLSGASLVVDSVVPAISSVTLSGGASGRYSSNASYNVVTLTFNVSESLAAGAARAVLSNGTGSLAMSCTNWKATAPNVTCTYNVVGNETEGTRSIALEATDAAGNTGYATTSVVFDFTAPTLISSVANPALAGLATEIAYTIVASEPLSAVPVPVFSGPGSLPFAFVSGTTYTWTHLVGAGDTSGTYAPTMTLTDLVGNSASRAGSGFQVDSVAPSIGSIALTGGNAGVYSAQVAYRSLGVQFNTGQTTAPASLSVTIANGTGTIPMGCNPWVASTPNVTCSYTVLGSEIAGVKTISIVATDAAGNAGYGTTSATFDFSPPSILTSVSPAIAPVGDTVAYTVTANEPLLTVPTPAFARLDGTAPMTFTFQSGTTYQWRHVVALGDLNGTYGPSFTVSDRVGNAVSYVRTAAGMATFEVDATIPAVSSITTTRPRYSRMAGYNLLSVSFNTSEDLVDGTLSVYGDGRVMTCGPRQASTPNYTCTRSVDGSDTAGAKTVSIMARDKAGNVGFGSTTVEFDFTAPTLLSTAVSVPRVKLNSTVYYTVSPSEPLAAAPTLTVTRSGGSQTLSFGHVAGTEYMYAFTSASTNTNGTYLASVSMTDTAGNPATVSTGTASFELDVTVPTLSAVTTSGGYSGTRFSAVTGFDNLVVRFNCPESVSAAPASLGATVGGATMSCSGYSTTAPNYTCSYSVPVGATSGLKTIALTARDAAGNESTASAAVEFDLVAPAVVAGSEGLEILPAASNVLSHPTKLALGTQVRVSFTATELLRASPDPVVDTDKGLSFTRFDSSGASYVYTHTLSGSPAQSVHTVRASLVDLVGNAAVANLTLPAPGFDVDTVAPGIPDVLTTDRIVYKRYPWGTTSTGSVKSFRLSGASSAMPTGTSHVAVWDGADPATASRLGLSTVAANGSFAEFELFRADHASVYVTAVDAAGNLSAAREVRDVTWTASYGGKVVGSLFENSNSAETRKVRASYLSQSGEIGVSEATATGYQNLAASDGTLLQTTAGARWRNVSYGLSPESRYGAASAYDSTRGVVTMFGGQISTGCNEGYADLCAYTWEWDGKSWMPAETTGPSPRRYASMAYDERRRKMVLFGGIGISVSRETWEWDAVTRTWREFPTPSRGYYPSSRYGAAMAYDATRGRIVMFGGYDGTGELGDTWEFDGVAWTKEATDPGTPETYPSARHYASMAYQGSGKVLLFGGYNAATCPEGGAGYYTCSYTWEWDGLAWTKRAPATSPPRRRWGGMAWDRTRGRVMLFGGYDTASLNDTWEWSPTGTWTSRGSGPAGIRYGHMMAMGPTGPVLFGGLGDSGTGCAGESGDSRCPWVWTYSLTYGWRSSFVGPGVREAAAMAYDGSGTTLLFGGRDSADNAKSETWQWTGTGWKKLTPTTTPTARSDHAMAYISGYDDILMFGGRNSAGTEISETHTWAGSNWTLRSPTTVPSARKGHAIAPISTTQAILFGGVAGTTYTNSQYLWDHAAGTWTLQSPTRPSARAYHRMVWDSYRNVVVLFGGMYYTGSAWAYYNQVWEYDVATGTWDQKLKANILDPWPTGRAYHVMAYDPDRRRTVMFGGLDADGNRLEDTWEWNGTYWSQMSINGTTPAARILASASYDSVAKRMLLYGGTSADDLSDTWEYDSGALANPANVFSINFGAATQRPVTVRGLAVSGVGGGVGYPSGTTTNGADLTVWDEGAWVQEDTNTNSEASPGSLSFSVTDLVRLGRLFIGNEKVASISSATTAASGAGTARGAVSTDYLQATVTYSHAHYFLSEADDTMSWTDAEAECVLRGGHLASVSSAHEQTALETLLKNVNTAAWIGLGDSASEGSFVWSDGTPYSYTHWYTGEPNGGAAVDCVSMGGGSPASFYWRDDYCTVLKRYLCEFDK